MAEIKSVTTQLPAANLSFHGYTVDKIYFEENKEFQSVQKGAVEITPVFHRTVTHNSNDDYFVTLALRVLPKEKESNIPIFIEVQLTGKFTVSNGDEEQINRNSVAILFPFLRSLVATITVNANVTPLIIPIINATEMFDEITD
jgi:preprotein translocase subunit SecB